MRQRIFMLVKLILGSVKIVSGKNIGGALLLTQCLLSAI